MDYIFVVYAMLNIVNNSFSGFTAQSLAKKSSMCTALQTWQS